MQTSDMRPPAENGDVRPARPFSARSVVASTLLGMDPPAMAGRLLVRSGALFGISESATRTALSRMVAAGELSLEGGTYRLAGPLAERHARQRIRRRGGARAWRGSWELAVVRPGPRDAEARAALRDAMRRLQLAELREGTWLRPDNLDAEREPAARAIAAAQCDGFRASPAEDAGALAARLWDLAGWSRVARALRLEVATFTGPLESGDTGVLADAFVLSARVLRHLVDDPALPESLLPADWPGASLRADYERYDAAFKATWRRWFRAQF